MTQKNAIQELQELSQLVKEAKADMEAKQAALKEHHKAIYMPMCIEKKDAEARFEHLSLRLKALAAQNAELLEALKGLRG